MFLANQRKSTEISALAEWSEMRPGPRTHLRICASPVLQALYLVAKDPAVRWRACRFARFGLGYRPESATKVYRPPERLKRLDHFPAARPLSQSSVLSSDLAAGWIR